MSRKRILFLSILIVCAYVAFGIRLIFFDYKVFDEELLSSHPSSFYDYRGATHVHTNKGFGTGSLNKVIKNAQLSKQNFIVVTDNNNFTPDRSREGYYENLLVLIDGYYSYLDTNFLNYARNDFSEFKSIGSAQRIISDEIFSDDRVGSGFYILAHPNKRNRFKKAPFPVGIHGIEVINLKSIWEKAWEDSKVNFLTTLLIYPFNQKLALIRIFKPFRSNFELWDKLNKKRPVVGLFGAHAEAKMFIGQQKVVSFPSYETILSFASNHLLLKSELTGDYMTDKQKIVSAIKSGNSYIALDILQDPMGFESFVTQADNKKIPLGTEVKFKEGMTLNVSLPKTPIVPFDIIVYKDGRKFFSSNSKSTQLVLHEPGTYRSVVRVKYFAPFPFKSKWINWIYTNPIYLRN